MCCNTPGVHWLAGQKNYPNRVMAGRFLIFDGMSNNDLINLLRSGEQSPVRLTFHHIRTDEELAGRIAAQIEADSAEIIALLRDPVTLEPLDKDPLTARLLFIPNTYEVFWNTSAEQLLERMHREYRRFWNEARRQQAEEIGLSETEAAILASIVQSETNKTEEMARIAGVYMNRLSRGIPLQADPTVIYAKGDFTIRRVLNRHLEIDSPFNTYMYAGLPPGPSICPPHRSLTPCCIMKSTIIITLAQNPTSADIISSPEPMPNTWPMPEDTGGHWMKGMYTGNEVWGLKFEVKTVGCSLLAIGF